MLAPGELVGQSARVGNLGMTVVLILAALGVGIGVFFGLKKPPAEVVPIPVPPAPTPTPPAPTPVPVPPSAGKWFDRVLVVILENTKASDALKQPYLAQLAARGAYLTRHSATIHPSQPNYLSIWFALAKAFFEKDPGKKFKTNSNVTLTLPHLGDRVTAKGLTWKWYAQGYPGTASKLFTDEDDGQYCRKHVAALSAANVKPSQVGSEKDFAADVVMRTLPHVCFFSPDNDSNGHDQGVKRANSDLESRFGGLFADPAFMKRTLAIVLFDEDDGSQSDNRVYCALVGAGVPPQQIATPTNHQSITRLIEENFGLESLGQGDAAAPRLAPWG